MWRRIAGALVVSIALAGCGDGGGSGGNTKTGTCQEHSKEEVTCGTCACVRCSDETNTCSSMYCNTSCVETGSGPEDIGLDTRGAAPDVASDVSDAGDTGAQKMDVPSDGGADTAADTAPDTMPPKMDGGAPDTAPDTMPPKMDTGSIDTSSGPTTDTSMDTGF